MTDEEVKQLQTRILSLEEEIRAFKSKPATDSNKQEKETLEKELHETRKELADLKARFWDGKDRRAKERRTVKKDNHIKEGNSDEEFIGGPLG